jgi:hypothetical protein
MKQTTHPDHPGTTTAAVKSTAANCADIGGAGTLAQLTLADADSHTGHDSLGHREANDVNGSGGIWFPCAFRTVLGRALIG